jgi:hypothetical protein
MDEKIVHEILQDLFSSLEALQTQSRATSQFLKDKGIVNEEELAPYLEQAGNASSVRWLAARVRIDYLLSGAMKAAEEETEKESPKATETGQKTNGAINNSEEEESQQDAKGTRQVKTGGEAQADAAGADVETDRNQKNRNKDRDREGRNQA